MFPVIYQREIKECAGVDIKENSKRPGGQGRGYYYRFEE